MSADAWDLTDRVAANYRLILSLCDRLEGIADTLPNAIDRQECLVLARTLGPWMSQALCFEEGEVHPVLIAIEAPPIGMAPTLERLRIEHQMDQFYAEEVQETLRAFGEGRPNMSADAAGFMLRGFFEGVRRHVAFEESLLVPLIAAGLTRNGARAGRGRGR